MPNPIIWKEASGPSAGLVQQHYIKARQEDLKRRNPDLENKIQRVLESNAATKGVQWNTAYQKINKNLQSREITLNFEVDTWFCNENINGTLRYDSYSQMYERSVEGSGEKYLLDSKVNSGAERARVDDAVTFPANWAGANVPLRRGLAPGRTTGQRIQTQMQFGQQKTLLNRDLWSEGFGDLRNGVQSENPHFNPKTKQVFAALNYGKRPHGSSTYYGMGFLILAAKLKVNAMYYPGDTFNLPPDTSTQVPWGALASIIASDHGNGQLRKFVIQSCYSEVELADTKNGDLLLEAHVFKKITFDSEHIDGICIPIAYRGSEIHQNAKKWATKFGITLKMV